MDKAYFTQAWNTPIRHHAALLAELMFKAYWSSSTDGRARARAIFAELTTSDPEAIGFERFLFDALNALGSA